MQNHIFRLLYAVALPESKHRDDAQNKHSTRKRSSHAIERKGLHRTPAYCSSDLLIISAACCKNQHTCARFANRELTPGNRTSMPDVLSERYSARMGYPACGAETICDYACARKLVANGMSSCMSTSSYITGTFRSYRASPSRIVELLIDKFECPT